MQQIQRHASYARHLSRLITLALSSAALFAADAHSGAAVLLTAGSPPTSAPMSFLDIPTQTIQGVMPDIIREVGTREGFTVKFDSIPFPALIQSAVSGKIDLIVAGMTPTPKRAEVIDFAEPVYSFGEGMVVADTDKTPYTSVTDMRGQIIGAPVGTTYTDEIRKMSGFKEIKLYDTPADMFADLQNGRIKAAFIDHPLVQALILKGGLPGFRLVETYKPVAVVTIAIGVRKGNKELLHNINDAIAKMKADGTIIRILQKWHLN